MKIRYLLYYIKQYCYCKFFHKKDLCYPDIGGKGLKGLWHCRKCHPCGEIFDKIDELKKVDKLL